MSNLKTSLKIAILSLVGLIMSSVAYSLTEIGFALFVVYVFALAFVASLTVYVGGVVNRNVSSSKNVNAIILFLFGAVISFAMDIFLNDVELFHYIGIICVVLLLVSIFVLVARKLFKNELSSLNTTVSDKIESDNNNTTENN
ncbi:MAG: hypothetical protein IKV76_07140 [Clostridia bacterium]|nr:hypothetical protein [Clostridia bacterium]